MIETMRVRRVRLRSPNAGGGALPRRRAVAIRSGSAVLGLLCVATLLACGDAGRPTPAAATTLSEPEPTRPEVGREPERGREPAPSMEERAMEERAIEEPADGPSAKLGRPAPDFTLTDTEGKPHTLSALKGKTVVLEWFNPDCPFVKHAHGQGPLKTMASKHTSDSLVWLSINSSAPGKQGHGLERNQRAKTEYAMPNPILLDETGKVGKSYGAEKTPHLFVIDQAGMLVYRGGLDNAPIGTVDATRARLPTSKEGELVSYVDAALEDLAANRALRLPDTPAYGCTVKY
jgi:peroxiredoxin